MNLMKAIKFLLVLLLVFFISCNSNQANIEAKEALINANLELFIETFHNKKDDVAQLKNIVEESYVRKINGVIVASNLQELKANIHFFFSGFPDFNLVNNKSYIKDNDVFMYWTFTGSNIAEYAEHPATGKKVTVNGFSHMYFNNQGKLYKEEVFYNELDLLQQLGYTLKTPVVE